MFFHHSDIANALGLEVLEELGMLLLNIVVQFVTVYDRRASSTFCRHVTVETDKLGIILVLGQLIVQRNRLVRWTLISREDLQLTIAVSSHNEMPDSSATNILKLRKPELLQH